MTVPKADTETLDVIKAIWRADDYVDIALAMLDCGPRRTLTMSHTRQAAAAESDSRWLWYRVTRSYQLHDLDPQRIEQYFCTLHGRWVRSGYRVLTDRRPVWNYIWFESPYDGFRLAIVETSKGAVSMTVTSPTFRVSATLNPEANG